MCLDLVLECDLSFLFLALFYVLVGLLLVIIISFMCVGRMKTYIVTPPPTHPPTQSPPILSIGLPVHSGNVGKLWYPYLSHFTDMVCRSHNVSNVWSIRCFSFTVGFVHSYVQAAKRRGRLLYSGHWMPCYPCAKAYCP